MDGILLTRIVRLCVFESQTISSGVIKDSVLASNFVTANPLRASAENILTDSFGLFCKNQNVLMSLQDFGLNLHT